MPAITVAVSSRGGVPENPILHVRVGAGGAGAGADVGLLLQPSAPAKVVAAPNEAADNRRRRETECIPAIGQRFV
jgi:hypothetical protein